MQLRHAWITVGTGLLLAAGATEPPAAADPSPSLSADPACKLEEAATVFAGETDGEVRSRVSHVWAAADDKEASLTFTAHSSSRYDTTPWNLYLARLGPAFPAGIELEQPEDSAAVGTPDPHAVPLAFDSRLGVLGYGVRDQPSFRLVPNGGVIEVPQYPSALAAASAGDRVLGASAGQEGCSGAEDCTYPEQPGRRRYSVRSHLFLARKGSSHVLHEQPGRRGNPASPFGELAVALSPSPEVGGAIAFVAGESLLLVRIGPDGARRGDVEVIATGRVGQPTLAYRGDRLLIVWVEMEAKKRAGSLLAMELPAGERPSAQRPVPLPTRGGASEPSLRIAGDTLLLAWSENKTVQLGATRGALADVTAHPLQASTGAVAAGAPALATIAGDPNRGWMAWAEFPRKHYSGVVRAARVRCR